MTVDMESNKSNKRHNERGAALLTVLYVATLLLATGGALVLITTTATRTAIDSTAEMQAYYNEFAINMGSCANNSAKYSFDGPFIIIKEPQVIVIPL